MICKISNSYLWIRLMLVAFVGMISYVYADIVILRADDVRGINVQTMIQNRTFSLPYFKSFVKGESFDSIIKRFFIDQGDSYKYFWQMPGCCVFQYDQCLQLLISQKRNVKYDKTTIADNDPGVNKENKKLFNYSKNMHTERQLILGDLYARFASSLKEKDNPNNENIVSGELANRALIMPVNIFNILDNGKENGSMYIYVQDNPCQNVSDNGGISCVDYYSALAGYSSNIDFNVYFDAKDMKLNSGFISKNELQNKLLCFIGDRLSKNEALQLPFLDCKNNMWVFVLINEKLLKIYKNKQDLSGRCDFEFVIGNFSNGKDGGNFRKLLTAINDILAVSNNNGNYSIIMNEDRTELFNSIHNPNNIPNIHYYPI